MPTIPDVTGHGGDFLETDGTITQWEPVSGSALPDQTGHAGEFLTTNGTVASWAPANTLINVFDIRLYGALSVTDPADRTLALHDNIDAIEAAIAAWTQQNTGFFFGTDGPVGGVYVPAGNWYVSRPIMLPAGCLFYGDGEELSTILSGVANSSEPTLVAAFGGPLMYLSGKTTNSAFYPAYGAPLVGVTGQSMTLKTKNDSTLTFAPMVLLDDCYPWGSFLYRYASELCLRCWVQVTDQGGSATSWLIGTRDIRTGLAGAVALEVVQDGGNIQYRATLTTAVTGQQQILSSPVALGSTAHNLEIDYNGFFFDFYVDGVNQGHLSASGKVYRTGFEQASLGDNFAVFGAFEFQPNGAIDSIELADTARHTGTGSFTPPTSKYAADSHTLWLCNFDQPSAPTGQPFFVAESAFLTIGPISETFAAPPSPVTDALPQPSHQFPCPHYARISGYVQSYVPNVGGIRVQGIQLVPRFNNSGIVLEGASRAWLRNVSVYGASGYGVYVTSNNSFYGRASTINSLTHGVGMVWLGVACEHVETEGCNVGFWGVFGGFEDVQDQPSWDNVCSFVWGPRADAFSSIHVSDSGNDAEAFTFSYQICASYLLSAERGVFQNNVWDTSSALAGTPAFLCRTGEGGHKHIGDGFIARRDSPGISTVGKAPAIGAVDCDECDFPNGFVTDIDGFLSLKDAQRMSNQLSIGTNDVPGNNLAGFFTIMAGYTSGGATFLIPEPDANYIVSMQYVGYEGSAPAAGSTEIAGYTTTPTAFVATIPVDPGGTCLLRFSWLLVRVPSPVLYRDYLPTVPSSVANALVAATPTGDFAVAATLVPAAGHMLLADYTKTAEIVATAGSSTNQWALKLTAGCVPSYTAMGLAADAPIGHDFVSYGPYQTRGSFVTDGHLYGLANPGTHNVCIAITSRIDGLGGLYAYVAYVDGGYALPTQFVPGVPQPSHGTQQTPIYIGQNSGGTELLTSATLRSFQLDENPAKAITIEQDAGPQAGQDESAFFGEDLILGSRAGAAGLGGWAQQIAEAKYTGGPTYYWFAARSGLRTATLLSEFWVDWGQFQDFSAIVIQCGYWDLLLDSATGAATWAPLLSMLEGVEASIAFIPPTKNTNAWAEFVPPTAATSTCIINGVTVVSTFNTSAQQTAIDTAALINANGSLNTLVTATGQQEVHGNWIVFVEAKTPGFAGNGLSTATNGANGSFWFPGTSLLSGANAQLVITPSGGSAQTFDVVFDTDADTTVNNLIADIAANPTTNAIVTGTLASHQCVITANAVGLAGNDIGMESKYGAQFNNSFANDLPPVTTLQGGADGARGKVPSIILSNCIPFGDAPGYSAGKNTQRGNFNTLVSAYAGAHGGDGVALADCESTVWDAGDHTKVDPTMLAADNETLNDTGHAALEALIGPMLP
jgi:hypothetical protein